jgi:hypothetical protein
VRSVRITLAVALALTLAALGFTLSRRPLVVAGTNSIATEAVGELDDVGTRASTCQQAGVVPAGTTAIRVSLEVRAVGPAVTIKLLSGSRVITEGSEPAGWGVAPNATVPVRRVADTVQHARMCVTVGETVEPFRVRGAPLEPNTIEVDSLREIRLAAEYLRSGHNSWWSLASAIARHLGMGNWSDGPWLAFLGIALMLAIALSLSLLTVRELASDPPREARLTAPAERASSVPRRAKRIRRALRGVPRSAWICALIACLNAACWSLIMPPFQVPDEESHFAYTQELVENLQLPKSYESTFSAEEEAVLIDLHHEQVRGSPETHTISTPEEQRILQSALAEHLSRHPNGVGGAARYPPLYYLLETVPYVLSTPGTLLDQLELMRLFSALLAGVTALFCFLFVREALPARRWAWTVGGLCVAVAPLLGFISGAVNPDALLFAVSASIFYCLARAFRRGLTRGLAIAIGCLMVAGFLTKPNFVGLAPGIVFGLVVLAARASRIRGRRDAAVSLGLALAIAASPVCVYVTINLLSNNLALGVVTANLSAGGFRGSLIDKLSYVWGLYLPRLPGMTVYFPALSTTRLWFNRSVGFYGWLDTTFPLWVDTLALIPAGAIGLLCLRGLATAGARLKGRAFELLVYAAMGIGLAGVIGLGAISGRGSEGLSFVEPRYLAPLLPLLAAVCALAARGAGRRWGPAVGAAMIVLFLAHDVLSQLLVVGRYYG